MFSISTVKRALVGFGSAVAVQAAAVAVHTAVVTVVNRKLNDYLDRNSSAKSK